MTKNHRYIPGLDGLRAFAVLSVLAYHFGFGWARGGFLGVDIFFVLSGYLITSIIVPENGKLNLRLGEFWWRRFRRLIPAAYTMITLTFIWVALFKPDQLHAVRGDALSSIFYMSNWWFIFNKLSYFDTFGAPSPFKNLWSLAIEEQFYIVWPMLLMAGFFLFKKRSHIAVVVFMGVVLSSLLMGLMFEPGTDPSRVYYGTDTRSFELLTGCLLAFVWPINGAVNRVSASIERLLNGASVVALGVLIFSVVYVDEYQTFLYRGGLLFICLVTALLIACTAYPVSWMGRFFSYQPLRWVGSRSYGIYLWHYPVIVLGTPVFEMGNPSYWRVALQLVLIFIIAECSYRLVETPIRRFGFRYAVEQLKSFFHSSAKRTIILSFSLTFLLFFTVFSESEKNVKMALVENKPEVIENRQPQDINEIETNPEATISEGEINDADNAPTYIGFLAIGDSVMLDIATELLKLYPSMTVDGKVGRQVVEAVELAKSYQNFNVPGYAVVIELGTNGYFTEAQIDSLLQSFSKADVYLVNTRVPRTWETNVNTALAEKAEQYEHITLVDWYSLAIHHPEYFAPDGVHLVPEGVEALTRLIKETITINDMSN